MTGLTAYTLIPSRRDVIVAALEAAHAYSEAITHALGWGLALTASTAPAPRPALRREGNVIYLPLSVKR